MHPRQCLSGGMYVEHCVLADIALVSAVAVQHWDTSIVTPGLHYELDYLIEHSTWVRTSVQLPVGGSSSRSTDAHDCAL